MSVEHPRDAAAGAPQERPGWSQPRRFVLPLLLGIPRGLIAQTVVRTAVFWALLVTPFLLLLLVGVPVFWLSSVRNERVLAERWEETFGRHGIELDATRANATTFALRAATAQLGFRLSSHEDEERSSQISKGRHRPTPEPADVARWEAVQGALAELRSTVVRSESGKPLEVPPPVVEYLDRSRATLADVVRILEVNDPPTELGDPSQGSQAPLPNVVGYLHLSRVLAAAALLEAERGDLSAADRLLAADWRLHEDLRQRPELIFQLIVHAHLGSVAAIGRHIALEGDAWRQRIRGTEVVERMRVALLLEAWWPSRTDSLLEELRIGDSGYGDRMLTWLMRRVARFMLSDYGPRVHDATLAALGKPITEFDPPAEMARQMSELPRWNIVGRILLPNLLDSWTRAHRVALDLELTDIVLQLRQQGRGHVAVPGALSVGSCAVPELHWTIERGDSELVLRLDGSIYRRRKHAPSAPLRWRAPLDPSAAVRVASPLQIERRWPGC